MTSGIYPRIEGKIYGNKGQHQSPEAKKKIGFANSGKNNGMFGKHLSKEAKEKLRIINTGKKLSEKTIEKIRLAQTGNKNALGYKHTKEHNRKIGIANSGENSGNYKGDKVGYKGLHKWVRNNKPKPQFCENCNEYPPYDTANISGLYKRDINDFRWLCRKCHFKIHYPDGMIGKNLKNGKKAVLR